MLWLFILAPGCLAEEAGMARSEQRLHTHINFLSTRADVSGSATRRDTPSSVLSLDENRTLSEDLKVPRGMNFDPIPAQLFTK